jgi:hypothetical protein
MKSEGLLDSAFGMMRTVAADTTVTTDSRWIGTCIVTSAFILAFGLVRISEALGWEAADD